MAKKQRILTDGFITHECDRHTDTPWGIFGGGEGQCGAVEIYNAARPDDITERLNERLGNDWSFDVQRHHRNGGGIEVTAELKSNGTRVMS